MAIGMVETFKSRPRSSGDSPAVTFYYLLTGTTDDGAALSYVETHTPQTYDGLRRASCAVEPECIDTVTGIGRWLCTVRYAPEGIAQWQTGESVVSFDTTGGTQHITHSKANAGIYSPDGETAPDFKGAIGVISPDNVAGVDIVVPVYKWCETHFVDDALLTVAYRRILFDLTGCTNDGRWREFERSEVLFLGARGGKRGAGDWELAFNFAASPNRDDVKVGDIEGIFKPGWHYLWVRYQTAKDTPSCRAVPRVAGAYVERIYPEADFFRLGLGA